MADLEKPGDAHTAIDRNPEDFEDQDVGPCQPVNLEPSPKEERKQVVTLSYLTGVELQVFQQFVENYRENRELRREDAIALDFIFGPTIQQVFQILEEDRITIRKSPASGCLLIEVRSKATDQYWIPPGSSMCQCMAFAHGKKDYCKHVLAAHLFLAITPPDDYEIISDLELAEIYHKHFDNNPSTAEPSKH